MFYCTALPTERVYGRLVYVGETFNCSYSAPPDPLAPVRGRGGEGLGIGRGGREGKYMKE